MRATTLRLLLTIAVGLSLTACMQTAREEVASNAVDDEAFCAGKGAPGSNNYAACMKDRDVARSQSQARMDRSHRRVSEDMLNGR